MSRKRRFIGEDRLKVDDKGRVSVPAAFRRVLAAGDPDMREDGNPRVVIVYGRNTRGHLECFTIDTHNRILDQIERLPRASKKRLAMQRLYATHAREISIDDTGRLVLPQHMREKLDLSGWAFFAGIGEAFEIWKPEAYEEMLESELGGDDDDFDASLDASAYLDAGEGGELDV